MSQSLVFTLLALVLALPVLGAVVLRVLAPRLSAPQLYGAAALIFGVAFGSVLLLARANVSSLQVGELSLLLPVGAPANSQPTDEGRRTPGDQQPPAAPPAAATTEPATLVSATAVATMSPIAAATEATPTRLPTETSTTVPPTATPTETPSPVPPTPTPEPAARRTYVVQPGDTLRGIAKQFNVSVQAIIDANDLTPEQADALRIGQELIIP